MMRGCMKPITVAICGENSRDVLTMEEHVRTLLPDAEITKYKKGESPAANYDRETEISFSLFSWRLSLKMKME